MGGMSHSNSIRPDGGTGDADFGYGHRRRVEEDDRAHRKAYPNQRLRSAYLRLVGENPDFKPGDRAGATKMLQRVRLALADDTGKWTRLERQRLYKMEKKYLLRSQGRDIRFNLFGNRKMGLTKEQQRQLKFAQIVQQMKDAASGTGGDDTGDDYNILNGREGDDQSE